MRVLRLTEVPLVDKVLHQGPARPLAAESRHGTVSASWCVFDGWMICAWRFTVDRYKQMSPKQV
jgi:hypothetical protein